jgi:hypothetical protein
MDVDCREVALTKQHVQLCNLANALHKYHNLVKIKSMQEIFQFPILLRPTQILCGAGKNSMIANSRTKTEVINGQQSAKPEKQPVQDHEGSTSHHHQHKFPLAAGEQMIDGRN